MQDRVPTPGKENRVRIRTDDGQTIEGVFEYADEPSVQGSVYNKANVLPDDLCSVLELPTSAEPKDAFEHAALPEYALRIGDMIITDRELGDNFIPADGRTISKLTYPELYDVIGIKYGAGIAVPKTLRIGSGSAEYSAASLVCDEQGNFAFKIDKTGGDKDEIVYFGNITPTAAKIIKTYGNPYDECTASAAIGDDYVYIIQTERYVNGTYTLYILNKDGTQVAKDTNGDLSHGQFKHLLWSGEALYIFETDTRTSVTTVSKLTSPSSIGYESVRSISAELNSVYSLIGVCNGHVFMGKYRDGSTYKIGSYQSSSLKSIQQCRDGSLYLCCSNGDFPYDIFHTTDGMSFTKKFTVDSSISWFNPNHFWFVDKGALYVFSTGQTKFAKVFQDGITITGTLPNNVQRRDDDYPNPIYLGTDNGLILPYGTGQSFSAMLVDVDSMFKVADLSSLKPVPRIKGRGSNVE